MPIFFNLIRTPPAQQDKNAVERGVKTSAKLIQYLDQHLQRHAFVAGDQFSVGDIPLGAPLYRYFNMAIERPELPGVNAWYQRMCERPAFQKHVMIPFGESLDDWNRLEQEGAGVQ